MSMVDTTALEERIAERILPQVTDRLAVESGGARFSSMTEVMEAAKLMAISSVAVPKHLRGNVGACMAVVMQAIEWRLSPFAVANKSYSVNDRLAYESQLIQAVILQRAPIEGRFKVEFTGQGEARVCRVSAKLRDTGETVDYTSPPFGRITPKNSPLWKSDPDQQQFYYSGRALCRRHFPDVLLGIYDRDELEDEPRTVRDVTPPPPRELSSRLDALAAGPAKPAAVAEIVDAETGEITTDPPAPETVDQTERSAKPQEWEPADAYAFGKEQRRAGKTRRSLPPPEIRGEGFEPLAKAVLAGWDDENDAMAEEAAKGGEAA